MIRAEDLGGYYRIPADNRDLNYDAYFTEGIEPLSQQEDYNSHNTRRLNVDEMAEMLLRAGVYPRAAGQGSESQRVRGQRSMNILVTGSNGFIGKNLVAWLERLPDVQRAGFDQENTPAGAGERAGRGRSGLSPGGRQPAAVGGGVPHGQRRSDGSDVRPAAGAGPGDSDRALLVHPGRAGQPLRRQQAPGRGSGRGLRCAAAARAVVIYRLKNVFGKWCRPNYNSVVATFCHNIAHDLPITISDPARELELVYVDDVVRGVRGRDQESAIRSQSQGAGSAIERWRRLHGDPGRLAELIRSFREMRQTLLVPDLADDFTRKLYGTYLSYLEPDDFAYDLTRSAAIRAAALAEFVKSDPSGRSSSPAPSLASPAATTTTTPRPRSSWWWKARRSFASATFGAKK